MANTLSVEEAAQMLGLTVEQFKLNLKTHKDFRGIRPIMGGATMHFKEQDVQELARRLGLGSEPELQMGDSSSDPIVPLAVADDDQVEIGREPAPSSGSSSGRLTKHVTKPPSSKKLPKTADEPLVVESGDDFVPVVSEEPRKRDSDVKVAKGSDSDVRLEKKGTSPPSGTPTEEIDLEAEQKKAAGETYSLADAPKSGKSSKKLKPDSKKVTPSKPVANSDFELQLGSDSDSDFELTLADDSSDEVELGTAPRDVSGKKGQSGVKLNKPADSGISLEKSESDSEFELNLESGKSTKLPGTKSGKKAAATDSSSEFELTLEESSGEVAAMAEAAQGDQKDIFATDFDIPALDDESGSEAVQLEEGDTDLESSDFDLALDDSGPADESASEVVELDEDLEEVDEAAEARPRRKKKAVEEDEEESAEEALAGVEEELEEAPALVGAPAPARWGPLPALVLFPCLFLMLIVSLMSFELLHGMWAYRQGGTKPSYAITRGIASLFVADSSMPKE